MSEELGYQDERSRCVLPWVLLGIVVILLAVTAIWGYTRRAEVAEYAVSALLEQQLGAMIPPGEDPVKVATRISAIMQAVKNGKLNPEALNGFGSLFREYYQDRRLDAEEFESLLVFAENAVEQ